MKRLISILAIILLSVVNVTAQEVWFECDVTKVSAQFNQKKTDLAKEGGYIDQCKDKLYYSALANYQVRSSYIVDTSSSRLTSIRTMAARDY